MGKERVSVAISSQLWSRVIDLAEKTKLSRSDIVEQALRNLFKEYDEKGYVPIG